jgi:nucleotide-binding universal stress UspA family protein
MYKHILVCTDGSPHATAALQYAIGLAKKLDGRVVALHITDIRLLEGPIVTDFVGAIGAEPYTQLLPRVREIREQKARVILDAAAAACRNAGVPCETANPTGPLVPTMLEFEQQADLVVLGRLGEHAQWASETLGSSVERMVRASIKPCLVVPVEVRPLRHVLLAYDGSAESHKALLAGTQLAAALGAKVTLVTVAQPDHEEAASKVLQEAHRLALRHVPEVHAQLCHGVAEAEILKMVEQTSADLIVMGAYGHTRIRELILGSTTSHVLRRTAVPVLLVRRA